MTLTTPAGDLAEPYRRDGVLRTGDVVQGVPVRVVVTGGLDVPR